MSLDGRCQDGRRELNNWGRWLGKAPAAAAVWWFCVDHWVLLWACALLGDRGFADLAGLTGFLTGQNATVNGALLIT